MSNLKKKKNLSDGDPCNHPGCLSHMSHPCEGCGRVAGKPISNLERKKPSQRVRELVVYGRDGVKYEAVLALSVEQLADQLEKEEI